MAEKNIKQNNIYLILHNIRSAQNVGAIFRTGDAAGVSEIILTGYTPDPIDRFGRAQPAISKTALGAEKTTPWRHVETAREAIQELKKRNITIIGVEQDERATDYKVVRAPREAAFVFGNEVRGLSTQVKDVCDQLIEIPMQGDKESLNVATSVGIVVFRVLNI